MCTILRFIFSSEEKAFKKEKFFVLYIFKSNCVTNKFYYLKNFSCCWRREVVRVVRRKGNVTALFSIFKKIFISIRDRISMKDNWYIFFSDLIILFVMMSFEWIEKIRNKDWPSFWSFRIKIASKRKERHVDTHWNRCLIISNQVFLWMVMGLIPCRCSKKRRYRSN